MKRFAACVVAFLFLAPFALAQEPQQAAKEMPAAMLALVVTDSRGNHVRSLSKDDFHISIGGVPVGFETFAERGAGGAPAGEIRRIAVLFDGSTLSPGARRRFLRRSLWLLLPMWCAGGAYVGRDVVFCYARGLSFAAAATIGILIALAILSAANQIGRRSVR